LFQGRDYGMRQRNEGNKPKDNERGEKINERNDSPLIFDGVSQ
jgi:hypothetical protein